jgi:hypothetical protein
MKLSQLNASLLAAVAAIGFGSLVRADTTITSFTAGDLVVLRGGDAAIADTSSSTVQAGLYLDEYTAAGAYVGTIAVPQSGGSALTLPGVGDFQHDGVLSLSADGHSLSFAGYQVAAGSNDAFAQSGAGQYQPVIGVVGATASSLTTNTVVNAYDGGSANPYIRGAYIAGNGGIYTFGKYSASGATSNGGLSYVTGSGPTATTTPIEAFADWRDITSFNGQLYGGTGSSSVGTHGPYQISTGLPTGSTTSNTLIGSYPGGQSASALAVLSLPGDAASTNGANVVYTIGDQSTAGIVKYYWNGSAWINTTVVSLNATDVVNPTGLIAAIDPMNPNWVDVTVSGTNGIYTYVDESGYNGVIPSNAFSIIATPSAGEQFYGVAPAPTAVPEPTTLGLLGVGSLALLGRRSRRA